MLTFLFVMSYVVSIGLVVVGLKHLTDFKSGRMELAPAPTPLELKEAYQEVEDFLAE